MGMTTTEKILARASGAAQVAVGDAVVVRVETAVLPDLPFLPEGWRDVLKVLDPSKVVVLWARNRGKPRNSSLSSMSWHLQPGLTPFDGTGTKGRGGRRGPE
jgi:hypothetical protein